MVWLNVFMEAYCMKKIIKTDRAPQAIGPYSQAVVAGNLIFVSGQIPIDPASGNIVLGDAKTQARIVLQNAKAILEEAGASLAHVVKTTVYLKDLSDFGAVNEVYGGFFPADPPARATVEVSKLPKDASVEMDFIAWKG